MDGVSWQHSVAYTTRLALTAAPEAADQAASAAANGGSLFGDILIVLVLVFINGFFAATEMAVISLNDNKVRKEAAEGDKFSRRVLPFMDNPGNFLSTIQIGVTIAGFLSSAFAGDRFAGRIYAAVDPAGTRPWLNTVFMILITLLISYLSLVLGELVPKQVALSNPSGFTKVAIGPVTGFGKLARPLVWLLNVSTSAVLRLIGIKPNASGQRDVTEEEIRMMLDVSTDSGNIHMDEKNMIQNVFEFNDKDVEAIMTHRTNVVALDVNQAYEDVLQTSVEEGYTRLPVYEDTIDNIIGILNVKDLLAYGLHNKPEDFDLRQLLRDAYYTPESKTVSSLFHEMQHDHASLAVVIDEYGGVSGIITMEDLLEEIVGNIQDEYDDEISLINLNADGSYTVDGLCELDELRRALPQLRFTEDDEDFDTVAGMVLNYLDRIPEEDEHPVIECSNARIRVLEMDERRISKVQLTLFDEPGADEDGAD